MVLWLTSLQDRGPPRRYDDRRGGPRDRYEVRWLSSGPTRHSLTLKQDRGYGGGGGRRDDYAPRVDRYRDDRYGGERGGGSGGGDRRGGYGYDRAPRGPPAERSGGGYGAEPSGGAPPPPRDYDDRPRRAYD